MQTLRILCSGSANGYLYFYNTFAFNNKITVNTSIDKSYVPGNFLFRTKLHDHGINAVASNSLGTCLASADSAGNVLFHYLEDDLSSTISTTPEISKKKRQPVPSTSVSNELESKRQRQT